MLHEVLDRASAAHRGATALVYGAETRTFEELARRVRSLATGLERLIGPGDRIAILAENCPAYVECLYGAPAAGALLVLLNHRLHPDEWEAQLRATEASVLVGERSLLEQFGDRRARLDSLRRVVAIDDPGRDELGYEDILAEPAAHSSLRFENDPAWLIFTSGTTGTPKGAVLTHASLSAALDVTQQCRPVRNDDVYLFPFPLCHVSAYNVMLFHREARPIVLARRFTTTDVAELVQRHSVTTVSLAPTMLAMLLEDPSIDDYDLSSLRTIGYGASAIPESVLRAAAARFGCEFSQGYGMTELSGNAVFLDADSHRRALAGDDALLRAAGRP
ncbi:MAG TPA: AMP-binding protein [Acidimicrobiia bacterium]|nr:AMP-binding protein [Acidimicrobiia bacterium]